jgi:hypothetical protein
VAISFLIISFVIAGNGAVGAIYHVPFPVIARASWGFWGSYIAIISRLILAVFWFAIQNVNGGNSVRVMIGAIWPSYLDLHNDIPASQGITTNGMVAFLIFWIFQFPFLCMHPNKLRWLFTIKSIVVPIAWIAILIWAFVAEKGGGGIFAQQKATVSGSKYSWLFLANMTSVLGNYATLSVNQASPRPRYNTQPVLTYSSCYSLISRDTPVSIPVGNSSTSPCSPSSSLLSPSSALLLLPPAKPTITSPPSPGTPTSSSASGLTAPAASSAQLHLLSLRWVSISRPIHSPPRMTLPLWHRRFLISVEARSYVPCYRGRLSRGRSWRLQTTS